MMNDRFEIRLIVWCSLVAALFARGDDAPKTVDLTAASRRLIEKHGVSLHAPPSVGVKTYHGAITGTAASAKHLNPYLPILLSEWSPYPPQAVRKARLKRIVLCEELAFAGQRRAAIPDYENDDLYFDVKSGRHAESYLRKVIHHEFFHIIDFRDDGNVYVDERWSALNPKTFKYGNGGKNAQNDKIMSQQFSNLPGFLNHYSTSGVEEDKAEIYANMVVSATIVERRAKGDAVIRAKVERMRELLKDFCPEMDERFFISATQVKRA